MEENKPKVVAGQPTPLESSVLVNPWFLEEAHVAFHVLCSEEAVRVE